MRGKLIVFLALAACGNSYSGADAPGADGGQAIDAAATPLDAGADSGADAAPPGPVAHALPPAPGPKLTTDGHDLVFVISKMFLGDVNPDGSQAAPDAWARYGYDLDGKITDAHASDVCKPRDGGSTAMQADGEGGRDNSYGKNLLPLSKAVAGNQTVTASINAGLAAGNSSTIFVLQKLGGGSSYNPFTSGSLGTLELGHAPKRDGSDVFRINGNDVNGDLRTPKASSNASYVIENTWVSGPLSPTTLILPIFPNAPLSRAIVTMQVSADHEHATNGVIAGIITLEAARASLREQAGKVDPTLCTSAAIESILKQVDAAADIMADGSQDPTKECDAISIGVGFEAELAQLGAVETVIPPAPACSK